MDNTKALLTLSALASGVHPDTGEPFAADSPYQSGNVVRALYSAVRALEAMEKKNQLSKVVPANAGRPWTADEDKRLLELFEQGSDIASIARSHQRTVPGIQARLTPIHWSRSPIVTPQPQPPRNRRCNSRCWPWRSSASR
jgi:hypothetical protein